VFKSPRTNVFESDEGFSIEVLGRTGILYREGKRKLVVDSEILTGPSGMGIYSLSIAKWHQPYEVEVIDETKRKSIINNICRAFRFQGFEIAVI
jgi:hypothetical protein